MEEINNHKPLIIGIIFQIIFFLPLASFGQETDFSCDPNFKIYRKAWVNEDWNKIYSSLNDIDFAKIDVELRFWEHGAGHTGTT
jgi:hypothetical protein